MQFIIRLQKNAEITFQKHEILLKYRDRSTICGYVRNIGRNGQESGILTLGEMRNIEADMFTTVFIGNSETRIIGGKMITPRGYNNV